MHRPANSLLFMFVLSRERYAGKAPPQPLRCMFEPAPQSEKHVPVDWMIRPFLDHFLQPPLQKLAGPAKPL
eukprot:COSAG06_NODE_41973_length_386_cov_0.540070_1_plen_70_part_10